MALGLHEQPEKHDCRPCMRQFPQEGRAGNTGRLERCVIPVTIVRFAVDSCDAAQKRHNARITATINEVLG